MLTYRGFQPIQKDMDVLQTLVLLMTCAIILVALALRIKIAYPIALVFGGSLLGFIPGIPNLDFDPAKLLLIVLPPILFYAAFSIPYKEFQNNIVEILGLALGLTALTTLVIGVLFKWLFPDLPWALAFAFGAIVSPPDAVAATAILKRFNVKARLSAILEGESLVNDAMGLILYKFAVVALLSGVFSLHEFSLELLKVVAGGLVVGILCGYIIHKLGSLIFDSVIAVVFSFMIPYITYMIADKLGFSGVLAVVVCGLIGSRMLLTSFSSVTRILGWASWDIVIILLNCFVFILIGTQMSAITKNFSSAEIIRYVGYGAFLTVAMLLLRFAWLFLRESLSLLTGCRRIIDKTRTPFKDTILMSWCSMRGIVSLTAALALPYTFENGSTLAGRDTVIFLTFIIIFLTLVIPGLSLEWLLKKFQIKKVPDQTDSKAVRGELIRVAMKEIRNLWEEKKIDRKQHYFLIRYFSVRHKVLELTSKGKEGTDALDEARVYVLGKKRERLIKMWQDNEISDQLFASLEHELDLEESYIVRSEI